MFELFSYDSSEEEPFSAEESDDYIPSATCSDSNSESFKGYAQGPCSITTEVHENQSYENDMEGVVENHISETNIERVEEKS
ncbi:hypothetical protein ILUMI_16370 [Ignelater luminosus]|uniref:Uncharacterized protein n=1 Tax=Ignelater luminosus TaxID=2038154 RepID=A0A8K0CSF3_IGNLU|nr:hypothetical protein ILUMI_16370 [Ignelater luminosus]